MTDDLTFHPPHEVVTDVVARALAEDVDERGDLTAQLIDEDVRGTLVIMGREDGVVAGTACATEAFFQVDPTISVTWHLCDGDTVSPGDVVATISGNMRMILTAERTALNFISHLSGVATATAKMVAAVTAANPKTKVLDTRKTLPGLRVVQKAAVRAGGGHNHRMSLSDGILIKDNHLGAMSITEAVERCHTMHPGVPVEVECDLVSQVEQAVSAGADSVLLDNMTPDEITEAVAAVRRLEGDRRRMVEVSGGITLDSAPFVAQAGADYVSSGSLTHSVQVLDFGLDLSDDREVTHAFGH